MGGFVYLGEDGQVLQASALTPCVTDQMLQFGAPVEATLPGGLLWQPITLEHLRAAGAQAAAWVPPGNCVAGRVVRNGGYAYRQEAEEKGAKRPEVFFPIVSDL